MLRICVLRRGKSVDISVKPPSRRRGKVVLQFTLRHDHCWSFCRVGGCYFPQKMARNGWHVQLWRHRRRIWLIFLKIWRRIWTVEECNTIYTASLFHIARYFWRNLEFLTEFRISNGIWRCVPNRQILKSIWISNSSPALWSNEVGSVVVLGLFTEMDIPIGSEDDG